jgi:malonyl CoA-acyl carrier protein transacylase
MTFDTPRIPVYSNVTAALLTSAADIPAMLARQLVEPVQVTKIAHLVIERLSHAVPAGTCSWHATTSRCQNRTLPWL